MNEKVKNEVKTAFKDCWNLDEDLSGMNLGFHASEYVSKADAISILNECLPDGYNEFETSLLNLFSDNTLFQIAREYSVALYVKNNTNTITKAELGADEMSLQKDGSTRIWWD